MISLPPDRAILAPTNKIVDDINTRILTLVPQESKE
jgi:hypothetical protein